MNRTGISGKVAVVTGAGQGIGAAVTRELAQLGAVVAALDQQAEQVRVVAADTEGDVRAYPADVTDAAAVHEAVDRIEQEVGPIELLANVAGVLQVGAVRELTDEEWERTFAVNSTGVFHTCRSVSDRMIPRGRGAIVTTGSNAAGIPRHGMAAYAASKAAATMFTKSLGLELAEYGIRCNIVAPGSTDTDMQRGMWTAADGAQRTIAGSPETFKTGIPLGKLAGPDDIADAVVFLLSDRAGHITMHDLYVDGGATLRA